jgi:hypothetical protein
MSVEDGYEVAKAYTAIDQMSKEMGSRWNFFGVFKNSKLLSAQYSDVK